MRLVMGNFWMGLVILLDFSREITGYNLANPVEKFEVKNVGNLTFVNGVEFDRRNYYTSTSPATWSNSKTNCKNLFHTNAHLVSVDSEEELEFLKEYLEEYSGTEFWTSGIHDPKALPRGYRWGDINLKPIQEWLPWAVGHPLNPAYHTHRISIFYSGPFNTNFRIEQSTRPMPFVCEIEDLTKPLPCYSSNDLVILLDASGSIGDDNFRLAKQYVARLASAFTVTVQNKIGFSTFANSVQTIFNLTTPFNPDQIESWILNAPYTSGGTQTNLAIDAGTQHSSQVERGVPQNIVVITDGQSTDPVKTEAAANQALAKGMRMFAVGITNRVNHEELQKITGYDGKRVFTAETWDDLIQLLAPVSVQICPDP